MSRRFSPAAFCRGGTSKGVSFDAKVLPADRGIAGRMLAAALRRAGGAWTAASAVLFPTARRLMQGEVAVPAANGS